MRGATISGLAAVTLLWGCGTAERTVVALTAERPHAHWDLTEDGDSLRLSLGDPGVDEVRVVLTCRMRSGWVDFIVAGRKGDPALMELESGDIVKRYAGAGHDDPDSPDGLLVEFPVDASDAVMRRVSDTGQLRIVFGDRHIFLPNAFAPAHDFLRACRAPR
ncbi:MAG: hypothetical protein JSS35_12425 [Proteobacteria bacterium]|nr:hypothetical protein [Pseudomonadota bacterium]